MQWDLRFRPSGNDTCPDPSETTYTEWQTSSGSSATERSREKAEKVRTIARDPTLNEPLRNGKDYDDRLERTVLPRPSGPLDLYEIYALIGNLFFFIHGVLTTGPGQSRHRFDVRLLLQSRRLRDDQIEADGS